MILPFCMRRMHLQSVLPLPDLHKNTGEESLLRDSLLP
jgi:hypothetical protein